MITLVHKDGRKIKVILSKIKCVFCDIPVYERYNRKTKDREFKCPKCGNWWIGSK